MYDEIPGLLYLVGVVFTVISWIFLLFSKNVCPKSKEIFILRLSIIWILFFCKCRTDAHFKPVFRYMRKPLGL